MANFVSSACALLCRARAFEPCAQRRSIIQTGPIRFINAFAAGGPRRHHRAAVRPISCQSISASSSIIENRARRRRQHRHAGRPRPRRRTATPSCFVGPNNFISASLYANLSFDFIRDSVPVGGTMKLTNVARSEQRRADQDRVAEYIALREGRSGQDELRPRRCRHLAAHVGRAAEVDDRHQHRAGAVPRHRRRRSPIVLGGQLQSNVRSTCRARSATSRAAKCARSASPRPSASRRCPTCPPSPRPCRATWPTCTTASAVPKGTPPEIIAKLNSALNDVLKNREAFGAHQRTRRRADADVAGRVRQVGAERNRQMGQGGQVDRAPADPVKARRYWLCKIPAFSTSSPQRTISAIDKFLELLRRRRDLRDRALVAQQLLHLGLAHHRADFGASLSTISFGTPAAVEIECHDAVL